MCTACILFPPFFKLYLIKQKLREKGDREWRKRAIETALLEQHCLNNCEAFPLQVGAKERLKPTSLGLVKCVLSQVRHHLVCLPTLN